LHGYCPAGYHDVGMKRFIRQTIQRKLRKWGYEIRPTVAYGKDPLIDMVKLLSLVNPPGNPVIFDVGANVGLFSREAAGQFHGSLIHAFEPDPDTFKKLQENTADIPDLTCNNCGLGAINGELAFGVSDHPEMSSFLAPDKQAWGQVLQQIKVPVQTIDDYCAKRKINRIDILKSDTQGYDLQVLRGAEGMMRRHGIQMLFMEVNFSQLYKGQPRLDEIYSYLHDHGFRLVTFYPMCFLNNRAGWTDVLFTYAGAE
jgi:FkbM family methyltransferase